MGGSLGPIAANLSWLVSRRWPLKMVCFTFPRLWLRYVDGVLAFWSEPASSFGPFLSFLNGLRLTIRFSMEYEKEKKLPFLDVLIERSDYMKPTHTDQYIHRESSHPRSVFKGLARSLACRASSLCSAGRLGEEKKKINYVLFAVLRLLPLGRREMVEPCPR